MVPNRVGGELVLGGGRALVVCWGLRPLVRVYNFLKQKDHSPNSQGVNKHISQSENKNNESAVLPRRVKLLSLQGDD